MVADCSCFYEAKAHCCYLVRGLASGPSKLETWTLLAAVNARPPYMAAFPKSMWLWIKDPFCRRPLTVTRAVATSLLCKCLVRGMPHKKKACGTSASRKPGNSVTSLCRGTAPQVCYTPSVLDSQPCAFLGRSIAKLEAYFCWPLVRALDEHVLQGAGLRSDLREFGDSVTSKLSPEMPQLNLLEVCRE